MIIVIFCSYNCDFMIIALALIPNMFVGVQMSNHKKNLKEETKELLPNHLLLNIVAGWKEKEDQRNISMVKLKSDAALV